MSDDNTTTAAVDPLDALNSLLSTPEGTKQALSAVLAAASAAPSEPDPARMAIANQIRAHFAAHSPKAAGNFRQMRRLRQEISDIALESIAVEQYATLIENGQEADIRQMRQVARRWGIYI